jgi:hypothetical protein
MYKILKDKDNNLILVINPQNDEPDGPMLICDGGDTALLFHDWGNSLRLKELSSDASQELMNASNIEVVEMSGGDIAREYTAPVKIVRDVKTLVKRCG